LFFFNVPEQASFPKRLTGHDEMLITARLKEQSEASRFEENILLLALG
jgi:hypothetical protein